jgi:hypothetical protein
MVDHTVGGTGGTPTGFTGDGIESNGPRQFDLNAGMTQVMRTSGGA